MSPEVWTDARARIATAAAALNVTVAWPNETFTAPTVPVIWLDVEASATADDPVEMVGGVWMETGHVWLHTMVPVGAGIEAALATRKSLINAFRSVTGTPDGLVYRGGVILDPLGPGTDDGMYRRLTAAVAYAYSDMPA